MASVRVLPLIYLFFWCDGVTRTFSISMSWWTLASPGEQQHLCPCFLLSSFPYFYIFQFSFLLVFFSFLLRLVFFISSSSSLFFFVLFSLFLLLLLFSCCADHHIPPFPVARPCATVNGEGMVGKQFQLQLPWMKLGCGVGPG